MSHAGEDARGSFAVTIVTMSLAQLFLRLPSCKVLSDGLWGSEGPLLLEKQVKQLDALLRLGL